MLGARCTKIPLLGGLVRRLANAYGTSVESAYLLTTAEAEAIVELSPKLAVGPCACRALFRNCDNPIDTEIMLGLEGNVFVEARPGNYREITSAEARDILRQCHERGLIHTLIRCGRGFYAICNCCSCCCVPLRLSRRYGIGSALVRADDILAKFQEQLSRRERVLSH